MDVSFKVFFPVRVNLGVFSTHAFLDWKQPEQLVKTTMKRCAG